MAEGFDWAQFLTEKPGGGCGVAPESPSAMPPGAPEDAAVAGVIRAHRLVEHERLEEAIAMASETGNPLRQVLIDNGWLWPEQLLRAEAAQKGVSVWDREKEPPDPEAVAKVPGRLCRAHVVLPIKAQGRLLVLAMADPQDMSAIDAVRNATGMRIEPRMADEPALIDEIERAHGVKALRDSFDGLIRQAETDFKSVKSGRRDTAALTEADTRPVVGLVNHILSWAIRMGASDVHLEPRQDRVDVRFRLDGEMQKVQELPQNLMPMLSTRLKIMSELDIVETRVPQDGRISVSIDGRTVDLRVSVLPNYHGPRIVLRILDKSISLKDLGDLGFAPQELALFRRLINRPFGMLLVTGPTGSGKTTTLYAALKEMQKSARNVMTCEDPVEYEIDGISQSQVNEKVGLTFAAQLRATLRQDPDIILVGEIRDKETAETAIRAALTGHFVLSTLHCTDATGAIPRLLDMGVDAYLLSTCLIGITAQRLIRTLCPHCSAPAENGDERHYLESIIGLADLPTIRKAVGCPQCFHTGYRGRAAVHEILPVTSEISAALAEQAPIPAVREMAMQNGYEPLQVEAIRKVLLGETTLAEAQRLISFDIGERLREAA